MSCGEDAMAEKFEEVTVFDQPMIFTCLRIDRETVPKGVYLYEVQHDSNCQGIPVQIAEHILVNHWGILLTSRLIRLDTHPASGKRYRLLDSKRDWNYEGLSTTLQEYLKKHPPVKVKCRGEER